MLFRQLGGALVALGLMACGSGPAPGPSDARAYHIDGALPEFFDCVRRVGGLLISAHRGGPQPGYPENSLAALENTYEAGVRLFEVDVATSQDGVLFLMHDRRLSRTTSGGGRVEETDWALISRLSLVDQTGRVTRFTPPALSEVLNWAVASGSIIQLDRKESTHWSDLVAEISRAGAQDHVVVITYSLADAEAVHRLAPDLMLSVEARGGRDLARFQAVGLRREFLLGWTGTRRPDPAAWQRLSKLTVEPVFGTLGRPDQRLDEVYLADGAASEYEDMARDGLVVVASDRPRDLALLTDIDDRPLTACARRQTP